MYQIKTYAMPILCLLSMLIVGCAGHDGSDCPPGGGSEGNPSNEMRFGVSSLQSRSGVVKTVSEIGSLGVFGYSTGTVDYDLLNDTHLPNLFWNRKVTRSGSEWVYNPVVYWPTDFTVKNSFFAYSPHSSEFSYDNYVILSAQDAPGNPTLQYSIPPDSIKNMFDILYAVPRLNKNRYSTDGVNDGRVEYDMRHTMSGIAFVVTGVEDDDEETDDIFHLNYLAFKADRMPLTAKLDLGYVPTVDDTYGDRAWGAPLAYGPVSYVFEFDPQLIEESDESDEENVVDVPAGKIVDPTLGKNLLLFFPKDIDNSAMATVSLTFIYNNIEYWYYIDMPPVYMHAGLVTVFLVTLSADGVTVEFRETNQIKEWVDGNPASPENPEGTEEVEMF